MLFFVDETWQRMSGAEVGALGPVAIPQASYNAYCREVYAIKKSVLGASEFTDSELKGQTCFARSVFKRQAAHGDSWYTDGIFAWISSTPASTRRRHRLALRPGASSARSRAVAFSISIESMAPSLVATADAKASSGALPATDPTRRVGLRG